MVGWRAILAFGLGMSLAAATVASAQDPPVDPENPPYDVGVACQDATSQEVGCDTEYTPVAKEASEQWDHIGGAVFDGGGELAPDSPTPYTVDFYTVRFQNASLGFAGGAACADPISFDELEAKQAQGEDCERVPVIYRYLDPDGLGGELEAQWEESYRGTSRGYVGAIAFTKPVGGKPVAVGGTGAYPRRELKRGLNESDADYLARDLAGTEPNAPGHARVWTYGSRWNELSDLPKTAQGDEMHGLSAVDCSPRISDGERCLAGGLRQLWLWQGEGFTGKSFTDQSPRDDLDPAGSFRYRVRAIRFMSGSQTPDTQAVAVTSGCCTGIEALDHANTIGFDGDRAYLRPGYGDTQRPFEVPDDVINNTGQAATDASNANRPKESLADSYYAVLASPPLVGLPDFRLSVVAAPGGPAPEPIAGLPAAPEPPSRVFGPRGANGTYGSKNSEYQDTASGYGFFALVVIGPPIVSEAVSPSLSTLRLVAGDGDFDGPQQSQSLVPQEIGQDGTIDWAVGELRSIGRGAAFNTVPAPTPFMDALDCPNGSSTAIDATALQQTAKCQPRSSEEATEGTRSRRLFALPTYGLNGFAFIPGVSTAWAVGDRGALLSLRGEGAEKTGSEPAPPRLGASREGPLPDTSAYAGQFPEAQGPVGSVPPLQLREERRLEEPRFVGGGAPKPVQLVKAPQEDVTEIVMSRDGEEGWALGSGEYRTSTNNPGTTLFHFAGDRWTRCNTDEVADVVKPDPACRGLASLRNAQQSGRPAPVPIMNAARVPLERDEDPSNDDEFEVVGVGDRMLLPGSETPRTPIVRYRDGRWEIDQRMTETLPVIAILNYPAELAFVAPDDGWLLVKNYAPRLYHWNGETWIDCPTDPAGCDAPAGLFPNQFGEAQGSSGDLVEADGRLYVAFTRNAGGSTTTGAGGTYPMVAFKDPEGSWSVDPAEGGLDPACETRSGTTCAGSDDPADQGSVNAISVARTPDDGFTGWLAGKFGPPVIVSTPLDDLGPLMRLEQTGGDGWTRYEADETIQAYIGNSVNGKVGLLATPEGIGENEAWLMPTNLASERPGFPLLAFRDGRWRLAGASFSTIVRRGFSDELGGTVLPRAFAPDGQGGFWMAARQSGHPLEERGPQVGFHHYTDRVRDPVFEDAPHPIREHIVATTGGGDGSLWVATDSNVVYRYSRYTGWDRVAVPGWDPGRVVTRPSEATAIAIGDDGEGLLVGRQGRIADLSQSGARLDPAAGSVLCGDGAPAGPCGTGRTLRAVAIGPDGSAIAGGDARAVMWRPQGEAFRTIAPPPMSESATITGVSLPRPERAYLITDLGQVWAGDLNGAGFTWRLENGSEEGELLSLDGSGTAVRLNAISLDRDEHGYAVGDGGVVLQRTGGPGRPWRRIDAEIGEDLHSVAQPAIGEGGGALVGGQNGVVYTLSGGNVQIARVGDPWDPLTAGPVTNQTTGRIVGLAILPGSGPGEVEAWAATVMPDRSFTRNPLPQALLRYRSDPTASGTDPIAPVEPLPDVMPDREGETTLAALGRTDCALEGPACPELQDSNQFTDTMVRQAIEEIAARRDATDGPLATVFTGDSAEVGGTANADGTPPVEGTVIEDANAVPAEVDLAHRSWAEFVAGHFREENLPLFSAIGLRDLSRAQTCGAGCVGTRSASVGTSTPWRQTMADMPAPWGSGDSLSGDGVSYVPVEVGGGVDHPDGLGADTNGAQSNPGARTHYALDVMRGEDKLLRLVFADNSQRSLAASEPNQNPIEPGGQDAWLDAVLCRSGEGAGCTRGAAEPAVVVANTPTYSYGPGGLDQTATDAATFEQTLLEHRVSALITGRLGWNGLYYTCAPQLHTPQPGGAYPARAPQNQVECAGQESGGELEPPDPNELLGNLGGTGLLPTAIAASAGGRFGPDRSGNGEAADGFWHGYSVIRIPADGDPAGVIVEQRPVFDWVEIRPAPAAPGTHVVRAGKKVALEGFGREVAATDVGPRYDEITTAAITHRYDLLVADPDRPWLPQQGTHGDACDPYDCLDSQIATIELSGLVRAGKGNYPRTFAVAELSVGAKSATYPLVFEPRASYRTPAQAPAAPVAVPPPPPPPAPVQPTTPTVNLPAAPVLPVLTAQALAPPPLPPSPPTFASQAPLDLNLSPAALDVTPPTAVSQPPTPPVNPAPPSGARREARQRQAAAQKSGADSAEEGNEAQDSGGDLAQGPPEPKGSAMTRHDFTAIAAREQPSAWARDALLGGGLGIAALILALGVSTARPTPRRRLPEVPAPAQASERASSTSRRTP